MHLVRNVFKKVKYIIGATSISTTEETIELNGQSITLSCSVGSVWINPNAAAVADDTAYVLNEGESLELYVPDTLSLISDATGGTIQAIVWDI